MLTLTRAVGRGVTNTNKSEVSQVQQLLNQHRRPPLGPIAVTGVVGSDTIAAIEEFQRRVVKLTKPDGRIDPGGVTLKHLTKSGPGAPPPVAPPPPPAPGKGYFTHPDADTVTLKYAMQGSGVPAVTLNPQAAKLLKSIVASVGMKGATLTSTLRTYHDQARITITQTWKASPEKVRTWYGTAVYDACKKHLDDIQAFADWWQKYDTGRGKVSSLHLTNRAMDVVPDGDRVKFMKKVQELVPVSGSGVKRIIPKGVMGEPVDHVEFTFDVT